MIQQRTLSEKVTCAGVGLHSGETVELVMLPSRPDTGIVFVRTNGGPAVEIPALAEYIVSTANATTLGRQGLEVGTVEHLLAALHALGFDNARIELSGAEVPVMDGSSQPFTQLLRRAGASPQLAPRRSIAMRRPIAYEDGQRSIRIEPHPLDPPRGGLQISYAVDFAHPAIGRQEFEVPSLSAEVFETELAPARTFGFLDQVKALWEAGLARGGSPENTLLLDGERVVNPGGLRFPDEFVRHKVLDLIGDLALLGHPIEGHVTVERGGHALHRALVDALRAQPDAWSLVPATGSGS